MKKKKNNERSFAEVLIRDVGYIVKSIFWNIPRSIYSTVKNTNYTAVKYDLTSGEGWVLGLVIAYFMCMMVLGCIDIIVWIVLTSLLGNLDQIGFVFTLFPFVSPLILGRYIWYRADKEELEQQVLKHNLEYFEDTNEYEELVNSVLYHD